VLKKKLLTISRQPIFHYNISSQDKELNAKHSL